VVRVKLPLCLIMHQTLKAHGEQRYSSTWHQMEMSGQLHSPVGLSSGKEPPIHIGWGQERVLTLIPRSSGPCLSHYSDWARTETVQESVSERNGIEYVDEAQPVKQLQDGCTCCFLGQANRIRGEQKTCNVMVKRAAGCACRGSEGAGHRARARLTNIHWSRIWGYHDDQDGDCDEYGLLACNVV
jgi:hypothetical protein